MPTSLGVGVIDTTSLWGAAAHIAGSRGTSGNPEDLFDHPIRQLSASYSDYFVSLLHNIILYDDLRTDMSVLSGEPGWYELPVTRLIERLSAVLNISSMPDTVPDHEIMDLILDQFIIRTRADLQSTQPSMAFQQLDEVATTVNFKYNSLEAAFLSLPSIVRDELTKLVSTVDGVRYDQRKLLIALGRQLSILVRTIRYSAHSRNIQHREGVPSTFCAMPRRVEVLRDYMSVNEYSKLTGVSQPSSELFKQLGLPNTGYDFFAFESSVKPLSTSDLSRAVRDLPPEEALDRVLELRDTTEAQELRRSWAKRLWAGGLNVVEGVGQSMSNVVAGRDAIQVVIIGSSCQDNEKSNAILREWRSQLKDESSNERKKADITFLDRLEG